MEIKPSMDISKVFEKARVESDERKARREIIKRIEFKAESYLSSELFFVVEEDDKTEFEKIVSKIISLEPSIQLLKTGQSGNEIYYAHFLTS